VKPLDPRLLRYARSARSYLALTVGLGILGTALVVAQALLLAHALASVVHDGAHLSDVAGLVEALAAVVVVRATVTGVQERYAHRAATRAIGELREQVVARAAALGPRWLAEGSGPGVVTLATRGIDALEPYFVRYLPQLVLAATLTPATLLVVLGLDWVSAAIIAGTLPLIPVFMVLVGQLTQGRSERGLRVMQRLGSQVLDLLAGLATLRALGRERGPAARVRELGDAHRAATMGTLRIAFLSGMVLELLTTLSVALVAVGIGLRLVAGDIDLVTGLAVLVLAPEVYLPLRQVGAHFHASTDGVAAATQVFAVLDTPVPAPGTVPAPDLRTSTVRLRAWASGRPGVRCTPPRGSTSLWPPAASSRSRDRAAQARPRPSPCCSVCCAPTWARSCSSTRRGARPTSPTSTSTRSGGRSRGCRSAPCSSLARSRTWRPAGPTLSVRPHGTPRPR
jgi:ATP-binding cassette subfamily C protein CydD